MKIYQMVNDRKKLLDKMGRKLDATVLLIETYPQLDEFIESVSSDGKIWVRLAYDKNMFANFRRILGEKWKRMSEWEINNGKGISYTYNNFIINVLLDTTVEGSICRKVQVGEKIEPVYKIICS